jgi:hypothetical protein
MKCFNRILLSINSIRYNHFESICLWFTTAVSWIYFVLFYVYFHCALLQMCRYGMKLQYDHYKLCVLNVTQPDYGLSWNAVCGSAKKRSTETCNSCCGDSGCNHGSCKYQNSKAISSFVAMIFFNYFFWKIPVLLQAWI